MRLLSGEKKYLGPVVGNLLGLLISEVMGWLLNSGKNRKVGISFQDQVSANAEQLPLHTQVSVYHDCFRKKQVFEDKGLNCFLIHGVPAR